LRKLAATLKEPGAPPWAVVRDNAATFYGSTGVAIMNNIARLEPAFTKQAAGADSYHCISDHPAIYNALNAAVTAVNALVTAQELFEARIKVAATIVHDSLRPYIDAEEAKIVAETGDVSDLLISTEKSAAQNDPSGGGVLKILAVTELRDAIKNVFRQLANTSYDERATAAANALYDPIHETMLRELETQFLLTDLLVNDPIISKHDPHVVADAVNQFALVSPDYARKPLLMRPQLRRILEVGSLDTFDVHDMVGAAEKLWRMRPQIPATIQSPPQKQPAPYPNPSDQKNKPSTGGGRSGGSGGGGGRSGGGRGGGGRSGGGDLT
jgi:uncharacterized membrane protein YgcG